MMSNNNDSRESSINRQVMNILNLAGQNEVIQSFVRSEASHELDESSRENAKNCDMEKKHSLGARRGKDETTSKFLAPDRNKEQDENLGPRMKQIHAHQRLGKNSEVSLATVRKKSDGKWNQRQRLVEEVYTDKDRAAAVNLGTRDIKQSLKLKRIQDRTRILEISEETHPGTFLALATNRLKAGDVYVALRFVDKVLEFNPYDKNALVARSKCHLLLGNAQLALSDAEQALAEDKSFIKGLYQKAEALYHLTQFEFSLMYFHRGLHIRPQLENFKQGVHKAQQAIINAVGKSVPSFEKFLPRKSNIDVNVLAHLETVKKENKSMYSKNTKLLKKLRVDEIFLQKLLRNSDLIRPTGEIKREDKIFAETKNGIEFLENRRHFWRQQQTLSQIKSSRSSTK